MIEITKPLLCHCNLCHSENEDVLAITLRNGTAAGGMVIMLCEKCRKELIKVLEEVEK